jgi:hypothetical protein
MRLRNRINQFQRIFFWIFLTLSFSPLSLSSAETIYYVDGAHGNNSNSGLARPKAFKTIQNAVRQMSPGDRCIVLAGFYDERVHIRKSGRRDRFISLEAEGRAVTHGFTIKADYVRISGFEITDTLNKWDEGAGIFLAGSFCQIRKNYIHDVTRIGISLYAPTPDSAATSNCLIQHNRVQRAGLTGIEIQGQNHLIEYNDISHVLQHPPKWKNPPDWADADGLRFFGAGHIFRKNYVHDICLSDAGNTDPHIDGAQTWGPAQDIVFERNFFDIPDDAMQGFMISEDNGPVERITVKNNIVSAFRILNVFNCEQIRIVNNTFISKLSYAGESGYGIELHDSPYAQVENNIFFNVGRQEYPYLWRNAASITGLQVGYNCHFLANGREPAGFPWPHDLWQVNPAFVDAPANNFRLQQTSALIDAGKHLAQVRIDFDGLPRPQNASFDIGAFEFKAAAPQPAAPEPIK